MLYPRESETREVKGLSGLWTFRADTEDVGYDEKWFAGGLPGPTRTMPVPASYNDITQDVGLRDHIGDVWYERTFFVPARWEGERVFLRLDSVTHHGTVWVNGRQVARHKGGYLPFGADVSEVLEYGAENRITVAVNNVLDWTTLPPGRILGYSDKDDYPEGHRVQEIWHDFFNYAGIHRPVRLVVTPKTHVSDITVVTDIEGTDGKVQYEVEVAGGEADVRVRLLDEEGEEVAAAEGAEGVLSVPDARLWQPGNAYLYMLEAALGGVDGGMGDVYRLPIGIRTVEVTETEFLINGEPFYFRGFGKHEDADIRGKGLDLALNVKDFSLLKWMGANSFRTSHYPYSEEIMNMADREGIVVIDESPAVGLNTWGAQTVFCEEHVGEEALKHHVQVMRELVARDKNHPCVVMWSVANEAATAEDGAVPYFRRVAEETRKCDPTRPVTIVNSERPDTCKVAQMFDVVCVNRYFGWYEDSGWLETIEPRLEAELRGWHENFGMPVIVTEYGADTIAGFHRDPPTMFTEEFQCLFLEAYHRVFDRVDFVVGEHVWNFADFATKQGVRRVDGNKKGVLTRQRQPKAAAHLLRERWTNAD
jgi:beta-glucuronidase